MTGDIITYDYYGSLYINLTTRCACRCVFCIRDQADSSLGGLWLQEEPKKEDVLAEILGQDLTQYAEIVFCGYGEPTCAYDNLIAAAKYMKEKHSEVLLRVNTNGLGELFNKKPIAEEMAKYIDAVTIRLNAPTAERYQEVTQPCFENAFPDMLAFAEKSK